MPKFVNSEGDKRIKNIKPLLNTPSFSPAPLKNIYCPFGKKLGDLPFHNFKEMLPTAQQPFKLPIPGEGLPRIIHYCADQSGCGFWRMMWPADELLAQNKGVVMTLYQMVLRPDFYLGIDAVRLQRQCTEIQLDFVKFLRQTSDEIKKNTGKGFRIIWEVDDICFPPSAIPDYNVCKAAFEDKKIGEIIKTMLSYCDEMVVVSETMRKHYEEHTGFKKISVIPNYAPKYWLDQYYNEDKKMENLRKNRKKPRILYAGSATHFDLLNKTNQQDDFYHIVNDIIKDITTTKKYQWLFMGGIPAKLRPYLGHGVEFHNWTPITEYPSFINSLNADIMIAPLADNIFSRSKANIKLIEAGALGIPMIAQNLNCYNSDGWKYLFDTSDQMFAHISTLLSNDKEYRTAMRNGKEYADKFWLKDHVSEWVTLYTTDYGDAKRKELQSFYINNKEQFP
jgi:glycosyltransferase involved in cell wall biosynthesis